jgi:FtsP/CotA-like multicopper oxidase with cupredoxin domain
MTPLDHPAGGRRQTPPPPAPLEHPERKGIALMSDHESTKRFRRRQFLAVGGGAALATGALMPGILSRAARAATGGPIASAPTELHLAATDGWASLFDVPAGFTGAGTDFPDPMAPDGRTTYIFGFRNVTGLSADAMDAQQGKAQISAPLLYFDEFDATKGNSVKLTLSNLGLKVRPDLGDGHTIHWHGFRNANPWFDGVPEMSISVPIGRDFTYYFQPRDPGTYMYHCHFEDVEHVQMGMTGLVFVRPKQNGQAIGGFDKFVFNDGDGSTGYDREFAFILTEMWLESHFKDAHIQQPEWSQYHADAWLMNGRCYPDTVLPNGRYDATTGEPIAVPGLPDRLSHQPNSSLITCNSGERVLIRLANLGYQEHAMTTSGIRLEVVGRDASQLRNGSQDISFETNVLEIGPGESFDALFTAPDYTPGAGDPPYQTYLFYDRAYATANNREQPGLGGQRTEIRVYPAGVLAPQTAPNT